MLSYLQNVLNKACIGLRVLVVIVAIHVDIIVVANQTNSEMYLTSHVKPTTLLLSTVTVSTRDQPQWSLARCETRVLHHRIWIVTIVAKKVILLVIVHNHNVLVGSSVVEEVNPVVTHVVGAPIGDNSRTNVVARIIIVSSLTMLPFPLPQKTEFGQLPSLWI